MFVENKTTVVKTPMLLFMRGFILQEDFGGGDCFLGHPV